MKICPIHQKELHEPNARGMYWHVINFDKKEYCNYSQDEYDALEPVTKTDTQTPKIVAQTEQIRETLDAPDVKPIRSIDYRIQRQHSQAMALEYLGLATRYDNGEGVTLARVKELTDHFQKDLE